MTTQILPENEITEFEGRTYLNPQLGVDETNKFITNLRDTQQANTQQISQQTQALGTNVPSSQGGLTGAKSYWTSRYQTPQTNSAVADLRATAQATALNEALANEQAKWKKRYNDAYRDYQKRSWNKSNTPTTTETPIEGDIEYEDTENDTVTTEDAGGSVTGKGMAPGSSRLSYSLDGYTYTEDTLADGRKVISNTDDPEYVQADDGYFYRVPTHDTGNFLGIDWASGLSDEERKKRANNIAQLERIRFYSQQQGGQ